MDRYILRDYYQWNLLPNDLVILYEMEGHFAGIIEITIHDDHIMIEMVGRNVLVAAKGVGTKLMSLVENIARQLGIEEIRLESLDSVVEWYDGSLGYEEYTEASYDADFGRLTPKRKLIR
jgi:N-acetylglutamate synthase-like GNAT family acetyltransferase